MQRLLFIFLFITNCSLVFSQLNFQEHTSYDLESNEQRVSNITNQPLDGVYQDFYPKGQLRAELSFLKGYLLGESRFYYDSGQLSYVVDYIPDTLYTNNWDSDGITIIGTQTISFSYSLPYAVVFDQDGESLGIGPKGNFNSERCYNESGDIVVCNSYFFLGERPVLFLGIEDLEIFPKSPSLSKTFPNGQLRWEKQYDNGCEVAFIGYYDDGSIEWKDERKNTLTISSSKYYQNGNIAIQIDYPDNPSHCSLFHPNGKKSREVLLKKEFVSETINVYNDDGLMLIGTKDVIIEIDVIDTQTCWDMLGNMIDCKDCWQCEWEGDPYPCED